MWLRCVGHVHPLSVSVRMQVKLVRLLSRSHTLTCLGSSRGRSLVIYQELCAASGLRLVPRSIVSKAGGQKAALTSINLLSPSLFLFLRPSLLLTISFPPFFTWSCSGLCICVSSGLFGFNLRCKGHSHHATVHLALWLSSISINPL